MADIGTTFTILQNGRPTRVTMESTHDEHTTKSAGLVVGSAGGGDEVVRRKPLLVRDKP